MLPVPLSEALELPIGVERANLQSLTQNMIRQQTMLAHCQPVGDDYSYSLWHLLFATFLTPIIEIFQVSDSQERASSKRFPKMSLSKPSRVAHDRALLGRSTSANLHTIFVVYKIMGRIFVPGCGCWVCNRAAVVDGGSICQSPHSRLRRQYGVIHNVTARAVNIAGNQMVTIIDCRGVWQYVLTPSHQNGHNTLDVNTLARLSQ